MSGFSESEGVFAINKPKSVTSAQVLRDLQRVFNISKFFAPWLATEKAKREQVDPREQRRRRKKRLEVKLGHGGTLDPMATGVLIVGVGQGTKSLQNFLSCTKTYEATILFGAATDTYDTLGKVLNKAPYTHVTQEMVEEALGKFRGKIMQRPPLYSALHVQGKRLYEYAREGKEVPVEIQERQVEVQKLTILEWLEGGSHDYSWPSQEAEAEDKEVAEKVLHIIPGSSIGSAENEAPPEDLPRKRKRSIIEEDVLIPSSVSKNKRPAMQEEICMSGALLDFDRQRLPDLDSENSEIPNPQPIQPEIQPETSLSGNRPPAIRLRMTVTSGFYVRSLAHDLGKAVNSLGCMCDLVRSKQERFELDRNVLDWSDIERGEEVWAPKLETNLKDWQSGVTSPKQETAVLEMNQDADLEQSAAVPTTT